MKYILFIITIAASSIGFAQNSIDALRYSRNDYAGTARFTAMGGAFGALGGEVSGLLINPAGIGVYRNSEFTVSTGFNDYQASINFRGETRSDGRFNMNIPNIAYVGSYKGDANSWKNYSFGISHNRINHFNSESRAYGNTNNSTIVDDYVNTLNANNPTVESVADYAFPFGPSQAYNLLLIDRVNNQYVPYVFFTVADGNNQNVTNIEQTRLIETRGNQSETQFSFGGNYQDRLYMGGSIGFQTISFNQEYSFQEDYTYDRPAISTDTFTVTRFSEGSTLAARGRGVNFKFGLIYRLTESLRAGLSIHSPTFLSFDETYSYGASSSFADGADFRADSVTSEFGYRLRTPARVNASLAYLFKSRALISVDYEFLNYSDASFNDRSTYPNDYSGTNSSIDQNLGSAHQIRVGAEYKFNPFVVRLGYNYQGNPYKQSLRYNDESRSTYSIGGGFRNRNFNFDVALNYRETQIRSYLYSSADVPALTNESATNLVFTVGWRW